MALRDRWQLFVNEYLIDLDASAAYRRAGYKPRSDEAAKTAANRLLTNVDVQAAIQAAMAARSQRVQVTQDYVITNLMEVVERSMQRAPVMVREGREMVQAVDEQGRDVWQFDGRTAVSSLSWIGKHLGMFKEKVEHSGPDGGPIPIIAIEAVKPHATGGSNP